MTLREQPGVPLTFRSGHAFPTGASRHRAGTASGLHPEDRPSSTDERRGGTKRQPFYDEDLDDDDETHYPTRAPSSARRYVPITTPRVP